MKWKIKNHSITKLLDGIKRLADFNENCKTLLSSSDLKRAFQKLGDITKNPDNLSLMTALVLLFMVFSDSVNYQTYSDFMLHNTYTYIYRRE